MSEQASKVAFETSHRVQFHETDMAGIVHFANFFRYMEVAEHEFLRSLGQEIHGASRGQETGWPRVNATCDYRKPARLGDELRISVTVEEVRTRSVQYGFLFTLNDQTIAEGKITAAHVELKEGEISAVPIPEELREQLAAFS